MKGSLMPMNPPPEIPLDKLDGQQAAPKPTWPELPDNVTTDRLNTPEFSADKAFTEARKRRQHLVDENDVLKERINGHRTKIDLNRLEIAKLDRLIRAENPRKSPTPKARD